MPIKPASGSTSHSLADRFLSKEQAAEMLHCNVATLLRWSYRNYGPPRIKVGRKVLYSRTAVEDWELAQNHGSGRSAR